VSGLHGSMCVLGWLDGVLENGFRTEIRGRGDLWFTWLSPV
jgi:hypothetical protein